MPKLSVYIADDVWSRAKTLEPADGPSQILQSALKEKLERAEARPYAVLGEHMREVQDAAAAKVARRLAEAYEIGYGLGLTFAGELMWDALNALAGVNFDLARMRELIDTEELYAFTDGGEDYLVDWDAFWVGQAESATLKNGPSGVVLEGFVDACRNLWEAAGGPGLTPHVAAAPQSVSPVDSDQGASTQLEGASGA